MTGLAAIRLVAAREIRERWRARSFKVSLLISIVVVAGAVAAPKVIGKSAATARVGVVGSLSGTARARAIALHTVIGRQITLVDEPDRAVAESLVRARRLDAAVVEQKVVVRVQPAPGDTGTTSRLASALAAVVGQDAAFRSAGLSDPAIARIEAAPPAAVLGLIASPRNRSRQRSTTLIGIILIYVFVSQYGTWVLYGVVEEKASRVIEVLLAALTPAQLLAGKILGIGTLAAFQGVVVAGAAFVAASVTGSDVLRGSAGVTVAEMAGWFVLGYAFYSSLYGAAGALVGRQEEVQNVAFPIALPLLVAYIAAFSALFGEVSPFVKVLSFLPPTAPIAMPVRLAVGPVPAWQVAVSVVLLLAGVVAAVKVAGSVYNRAVLRTGTRITWRQALRAREI